MKKIRSILQLLFAVFILGNMMLIPGCVMQVPVTLPTAEYTAAVETEIQPPVIISVGTEPKIAVRNSPLKITAEIGNGDGAEVYADISGLDNLQKYDSLSLSKTADGTYEGSVTLSYGNGDVSTITIYAVTGENVVQKTLDILIQPLEIELGKEVPNDHFNRKSQSKWIGLESAVSGGKLNLASDGSKEGGVVSNWKFTGDFDVQVDYELAEGWKRPEDGNELQIWFNIDDGSEEQYGIWRKYYGNGSEIIQDEPHGTALPLSPGDPESGKFRLIRTGDTLICLYDLGSGWKELDRLKSVKSPVKISIRLHQDKPGEAFRASFDNFQINSGLTTFGYHPI